MKKLLNISVIAALAVLPFAANAATGDPVAGSPTAASAANPAQAAATVTTNVEPKYALAVEGDNDANLATAGYVKGAYNATIKAVNKVAETAANALTADGTATLTNKTIDADDNTISDLTTSNLKSGTLVDSETGIAATSSASDDKLVSEKAVAAAIDGMVTETGTQTLTNKTISGATITGGTIDADSTTISNLEADNFKSGTLVDSTTGIAATDNASDTKLVSEKAVAAAIATATTSQVTLNGTQTLTNKTIDADDNTISDLTTSNLKSGTLVDSETGIAATSSASDDKLVSEKAVAAAIEDFATQSGVENTIETATITATVPTLTAWGDDTSTSTVGVTVASISATYAEPAAQPQQPANP